MGKRLLARTRIRRVLGSERGQYLLQYTLLLIIAAVLLAAVFDRIGGITPIKTVNVALTIGGSGEGVVIFSGGVQQCPEQCIFAAKVGSQLTLVAKPGRDSKLLGWSGPCLDHGGTCDVKTDAPKEVTVIFGRTN